MRSILLLMIAGCTIDLAVGRVPAGEDAHDSGVHPDGSPSDAGEPDAAGSDAGEPDGGGIELRELSIVATPSVMCADSLGGREAEFAGIGPNDVALAGGEVGYQLLVSSVVLSGAPIASAFGTERLDLREGILPDQPDGTFLAAVPLDGPPGPAGTELDLAAIFVDTLLDPPSGQAGFQYETASADGACFVSFSIALLP